MNRSARWISWRIDAAAAAICIVAAMVVYFGGVRPMLRGYATRLAQQTALNEACGKYERLHVTVQTMTQRLDALQRELAECPLQLQSADRLNERLAAVTDLVSASGLALQQIQPGRTESSGRFTTVAIHVSGNGSYPACVGFVRELRRRMPDMSVNAMQLAGRPSDPLAAATFSFELVWHTRPDAVPAAP